MNDRETFIEDLMERLGYSREQAEEMADDVESKAPIELPPGLSKVVNTPDLIMINKESESKNYNRTLPDGLIEKLDPEGTHVVGFTMPHEHAKGQPVEKHVRCRLFVKAEGSLEPVMAFLDMTIDAFTALTIIRKTGEGEWEPVGKLAIYEAYLNPPDGENRLGDNDA